MRQGKGYDPAIAVLIAAFSVASAALLMVDGAKGDEDEFRTLLINGFTATHSPDTPSAFEPVLYAPNRALAFGFLRVGPASLDLAVVHVPSSLPLWRATPARLGDWSRAATLSFDSSLVLTGGDHGDVLWQTLNTVGDTVALLNNSNLVVRRYAKPLPAWQSFDHPADTLVAGQNFTVSSPPLMSSNRRFALRMAEASMSLHMEFYGGRARPVYWQYTARMENVSQAASQVYGRVDDRGFFGLYVDAGGEEAQVDLLKFDTFAENLTGSSVFRRVTLDEDGNLRAYYWADGSTGWTAEYKAIAGRCQLPAACGAYGLCVPGDGAQCQCLTSTDSSASPPCHAAGEEETADLCGLGGGDHVADFDVVRRTGVSVAYKERLPFATNRTAAECEAACAGNCSCWGAVHHGTSGYCYLIDFPVETMMYDTDDSKVGYFKVRKKAGSSKRRGMVPGVRAATAVLALVLVSLGLAGAYTGYMTWMKRRRREGVMVQELAPGPYKDLKSMASSNNSFKASS